MDRYVPLKEIVAMAIDQAKKSIKDFDRYWVFSFRALRAMEQSVSALPKSMRLPVLGNKTVELPDDYNGWSKIGVLNSNGEVVSLRINNALTVFRDNNPNRLTQVAGEIGSNGDVITPGLYFNYLDNGLNVHLYGVGGGLVAAGECRVDEKNNIIILPDNFAYPDIILEYISLPEMDGDYYVEGCLQEPIIEFCLWKDGLSTEQSFYARVIEGRRSLQNNRVTLQTIHQVLRETGGQYLKS
jgi:hypothetical protein